jgi:hypothetical protein
MIAFLPYDCRVTGRPVVVEAEHLAPDLHRAPEHPGVGVDLEYLVYQIL